MIMTIWDFGDILFIFLDPASNARSSATVSSGVMDMYSTVPLLNAKKTAD